MAGTPPDSIALDATQVRAVAAYRESVGSVAYACRAARVDRVQWDQWLRVSPPFRAAIDETRLDDLVADLAYATWLRDFQGGSASALDTLAGGRFLSSGVDPLLAGLFTGHGLARSLAVFSGVPAGTVLASVRARLLSPSSRQDYEDAISRGVRFRARTGSRRPTVDSLTVPGQADCSLPYASVDGMSVLVRRYVYPEEVALALAMDVDTLVASLPRAHLRRLLFTYDAVDR